MLENLQIGTDYTRKSIDQVLGLSKFEGTREGLVYLPTETALFVTLVKIKRQLNQQYNDFFENDFFHWDSQAGQHIDTPKIQDIVCADVDVHLFARMHEKVKSKTQPFIYCGRLQYSENEPATANPVHIIFESVDYQDQPNAALKKLYDWKPGQTDVSTTRKSVGQKVSKRRARGQGYQQDPELKKMVELRAMGEAAAWYAVRGYRIENTSANRPYDLVCRKSGEPDRRVEVKGTVGLGLEVNLTANEISAAQNDRVPTDLFVVYNIDVVNVAGKRSVTGGLQTIIQNWVPAAGDLTPTEYRYRLPSGSTD